MESLIVILDHGAIPFCNYVHPHYNSAKPQWMSAARLEKAVHFAAINGLRLICLLGRHPLPRRLASIARKGNPLNIAPLALSGRIADAVPVLVPADMPAVERLSDGSIENAILRLGREDMPRLGELYSRLAGKLQRLNICLFDVGSYREDDFRIYEKQLEALTDAVVALPWPKGGTECNILTDRVMLQGMNNCEAGVKHLTVAPNGRFYLCPGFYYRDEADSVGSLDDGVSIENPHLLTIEYAPICRSCDAYQCRRCLLLNKQLTEEANTPSQQQCVTAHSEREASRVLVEILDRAKRLDASSPASRIPKLDYRDPFERIEFGRNGGPGAVPEAQGVPDVRANGGTAAMPEGEVRAMLLELRAVQQDILNELQQIRKDRKHENV